MTNDAVQTAWQGIFCDAVHLENEKGRRCWIFFLIRNFRSNSARTRAALMGVFGIRRLIAILKP
jgi:hypothetical protein